MKRPRDSNNENYFDGLLVKASRTGNISCVQELLERGVSANAKNKYGMTPLHEACYYGHLKVAKLLLEHGANVNEKCHD